MAMKECRECTAQVSSKAEKCPQCGCPLKRKTSWLAWAALILLILGIIGFISGEKSSDEKPLGSTAISRPDPARELILKHNWQPGGFGSVMLLYNVTIHNPTSTTMKDPVIRCSLYGASGTALGHTEATVFRRLPAKTKITITEVNMGRMHSQTAKAGCQIQSATIQ